MGIKGLHLLLFVMFSIVSVVQSSEECMEDPNLATLNRNSFPSDFVFGTASSAYQNEGAANEGGRGPSIWDTFTKEYPDKIKDHSNGDIAVDSYHRYKEDVALMKDLGFGAYRFSISWSRLIPSGHIDGGINQEGINYYSSLINELLSNGIRPFVTLFHWDVPQVLEDEYGSFLSSKIINDFSDYADVCFSNFGDRVKQWITLNEPLTFATGGYDSGTLAPGRCSKWFSSSCSGGDSSTEPYIVGHHLLLAHAVAVKLYRDKYKVSQKGQIGITLNSNWILPSTESTTDHIAASRVLAFQYDWFMEPLKCGAYPVEMVTYVQERLPQFSEQQSSVLKGSFDFIGINYYTSYYATDIPCTSGNLSYSTDHCVKLTSERNGIPIGQKAGSEWLFAYPKGIEDLLLYTKYKFNDPVIFITENGVSEFNVNASISLEDNMRVDYYKTHLTFLQRAIMIGANVKGFFAWSLLDNFEWADGYTVRFGIVYTDYNDGLERQPKKSATWFKGILHQSKAND